MTTWTQTLPQGERARLDALYDGALLVMKPTQASLRLVERAERLLQDELGARPREAFRELAADELFRRLGRVRRALYLCPEAIAEVREVVAAHGFNPDAYACDPARLRVVHPHGDDEPAAAAVYAVHRDIWYGHPPSLLTWWIPLNDLPQSETFELWPDKLRTPVANDSEVFDYDDWVSRGWNLKIGWQDPKAGLTARYPAFLEDRASLGEGVGFDCSRGDNLVFAGANLHATRPHAGPRTRFSLDLRLVHLKDARMGRGAPRVDDRSRGSALPDYVKLRDLSDPSR